MFCIFGSVFATVWFEQVRIQTAHLTVVALSEGVLRITTSEKVASFSPLALCHLPILS